MCHSKHVMHYFFSRLCLQCFNIVVGWQEFKIYIFSRVIPNVIGRPAVLMTITFLCSIGAKVISAEVASVRSCSSSSRGMVAHRQHAEGDDGRGQHGCRSSRGHRTACGGALPRGRGSAARRGKQLIECVAVGAAEPPTDRQRRRLRRPQLKHFSLQHLKSLV